MENHDPTTINRYSGSPMRGSCGFYGSQTFEQKLSPDPSQLIQAIIASGAADTSGAPAQAESRPDLWASCFPETCAPLGWFQKADYPLRMHAFQVRKDLVFHGKYLTV